MHTNAPTPTRLLLPTPLGLLELTLDHERGAVAAARFRGMLPATASSAFDRLRPSGRGDRHRPSTPPALSAGPTSGTGVEGLRTSGVPGSDLPAAVEELAARLRAYFAGQVAALEGAPVALAGTPFQRAVWEALRAIPAGQVRSYAALARAVGRPGAARAVGAACARNPIALLVPCHRAVGARGDLTGYAFGLERKRALLALERGGATMQPPCSASAGRSPWSPPWPSP